jgi:hypothetical protein
VAHVLVDQIDDPLVGAFEIVRILVDDRDPAERLMGRVMSSP